MENITLKQLCELVGVSRRSIQCYEKVGLMAPTDKNKYGHLLYDEDVLHRAKMIKFMSKLGFKLKEIQEIIDAPSDVIKEAFQRRIKGLEIEVFEMEKIIQEANEYIKTLK